MKRSKAMSTYIPINCSYYDELEAAATQAKIVKLIYRDQSGEKQLDTRIVNLYTKNKEEFMVLENGLEIRLDHLLSIDGKTPPMSC